MQNETSIKNLSLKIRKKHKSLNCPAMTFGLFAFYALNKIDWMYSQGLLCAPLNEGCRILQLNCVQDETLSGISQKDEELINSGLGICFFY